MSAGQPIIIKKKKGGHGGGHHGGSWKVAYADFVTAMMAFFMVMWIMGMSEETRSSVQSYFNDPVNFQENQKKNTAVMELPKTMPGSAKKAGSGADAYDKETELMQGLQRLMERKIAEAPELKDVAQSVKITVTKDGLQIEFVETSGAVFFESGSSVIRPVARQVVAKLAPVLHEDGYPIKVEGHTDAAPFSAPGGNWGLSTARAMSLMQELMANGCEERQFQSVTGFGATRLIKPEAPLDFSNRRVTILIPRQEKQGEPPTPANDLRASLATAGRPEAINLRPPGVEMKKSGWLGQ